MSPTRKPSTVAGLRKGMAPAPQLEQAQDPGPAPAPAPEARPRPEKPVRFTLDLDRARHQFLKQYALRIEADASQVVRVLLDQLRDDPDLATRVRATIWQARG
jgi:hypothetical protein